MEPNTICQYCYENILHVDNHLDHCTVYKTIMVHLNSSNNSEEELPSTNQLYDIRANNPRLYSKAQVFPLRPLKKSLNACSSCKSKYENTLNLPYLLPACGHTFCKACLTKMSYKSMIRCSMCNSMTYKELKKLPVNYALLEAFESQTKKKMCKDHNSEIMGYCNLDDALLCGTCMFNHRNHDVYLLTDPKITDIATSKKNAIKKQESGLIEVKEVWDKANAELESGLNELQISIEKHKKALASTEEKIIMKIKMGTNHCIEEISKLAESDECSKIGKKIKENLTKIKARLDRIVEIKHKYDALPIEERLKKPIENEIVVLEPPPSLAPVVKIMEKLKGAIDYELCIKKHNLSIS